MRFVHLSDLHFGRPVRAEILNALTRDILEQSAELIVVTGDVTDRGRIREFRRARQFLDSFDIPFITVPGNRDIAFSAFWEWMVPRYAMRRFGKYFGPVGKIVRSMNGVVFIGLNSVHRFPAWPGSIDRETRYRLRSFVESAAPGPKVIFLHHPVLPVIRSSSFWAHTFSEAGEILNICGKHGIPLLLQGHKHRSAVMRVEIPEYNAAVVVSCGGAPLTNLWDTTYHVIELGDDIRLHVRECAQGTFRLKAAWTFPNSLSPREFSGETEQGLR